ncbi:MAG: RNA-binding domain-containing protein [Mariniphaga sp.]
MTLHINIEDLLSTKTVESDRIEYKEGWNPDSAYRSICAFANDFDNTGGGYILIGVAENPKTKTALRPVKGLTSIEIAEIQQEMIGYNNLVKPYYSPRLSIEIVDQQQIIVLWVIAGGERPYEVPETVTAKYKTWKYFIRKYASSIEAKGTDKEELIALSNNIPFDDRANTQASINNISMFLVQEHLRKIGSKLFDDIGRLTNIEILQQMALLTGPAELLFPRNVALMLFTEKPHTLFPYTWVEIVYFPKGASDKEFIEKKIDGPVQQQVSDSLNWLRNNILQEKVIKIPGQAEALRAWNYPYPALEEAIANCLYHRNYQEHEPVTIRIEPEAILLYNSGGPDRSIKREDFVTGKAIPKRYRNRRLGDFLKELKLTEGHATGLPALKKAMQLNGSPAPVFDFDEERTWFQVMMPINPNFVQKQLLFFDLKKVMWDLGGIDRLLNEILEMADIPQTKGIAGGKADDVVEAMKIIDIQLDDTIGDIAGGNVNEQASTIAGTIAKNVYGIEIQVSVVLGQLDSTIACTIADSIAGTIGEKEIKLLMISRTPINRENLLASLGLKNLRKNYEEYIGYLVNLNWLTMTIPHKPTSPKQKYLTTLKGRLILEFLKHKTK